MMMLLVESAVNKKHENRCKMSSSEGGIGLHMGICGLPPRLSPKIRVASVVTGDCLSDPLQEY
jgi:hypothetical protein